jgi:hypothetical protein
LEIIKTNRLNKNRKAYIPPINPEMIKTTLVVVLFQRVSLLPQTRNRITASTELSNPQTQNKPLTKSPIIPFPCEVITLQNRDLLKNVPLDYR